jgi:uncharacterized Fe-S center protein
MKNTSIGYGSSKGMMWIHTGGRSTSSWAEAEQDDFLESMAEATKSVSNAVNGKILYINVMNHLSVDCDCDGSPAVPSTVDIGILGSFDPLAYDKDCVDLVYAAPDVKDLIERIESRNGLLTIP